jgi:cell division septation protein DedD
MSSFDIVLFDLLVKHNCVIVPDFGGFVSKRVSSKIDFDKGIIVPPSKHLLFNKHLTTHDGLLLSAYADQNGLSYVEAEGKLKEMVLNFQKELSSGKELVFPRIGVLKRSTDGFYAFSQDKEFNLLSDAYGLIKLEFDAVKVNKEEPEPSIQETPVVSTERIKTNPNVKSLRRKKLLRYAAAACLLPLMMYTFWIPFKSDFFTSGLISIHDFDPFYTKEVGLYQPTVSDVTQEIVTQNEAKEVEIILEDTSTEEVVAIESSHESTSIETQETQEAEAAEAEVSSPENQQAPYSKQYIVGCFSVKENAINFKNKIEAEGFVPLILEGGKLHRVSMGITYSKEEYDRLQASASSRGYNGWTLKQ